MLDVAADDVALDVLDQGQLLRAGDVQGEQGVLHLQGQHGRVAGEGDVHRVGAVAVHDGRDPAGPAHLARSALAERRTGLGLQLGLGHGDGFLWLVVVDRGG